MVIEASSDVILVMLFIAATISLVIGIVEDGWKSGWIDGVSIYIAVVIIVTITSGNNYVKEKQFQKLVMKAAVDYIAVYRGDSTMTTTIKASELVVGDLIKIEQGMRIPADCILINGYDVATDESSLTGEAEQMEK